MTSLDALDRAGLQRGKFLILGLPPSEIEGNLVWTRLTGHAPPSDRRTDVCGGSKCCGRG